MADPNAEYVASLSPEGRVAYQEALEGAGPGAPRPEGETPDPSMLGCLTTAGDEVAARDAPPELPALVRELQEQISEQVPRRVQTDGRVREAADGLVACVVDAGGAAYDPLAGESPYGQVQRAWDELTAAGDVAPAELAAFQDREREIAAAELRCTVPVLEAAQEVHDEVVREVVGPHRAELEALAEQWPDG